MKKMILSGVFAFVFALTASAQVSVRPEVLDRIRSESVRFDYTYSVATGKKADLKQTSGGCVTAQKDAYLVTGLGIEVRSDTRTRWTIDRSAREVLIETVGETLTDELLLTPTLAICRYEDFFTPKFVERKIISGGIVDRFDLQLKKPSDDMSEVYLLIMQEVGEDDAETVRLAFGFKGSNASWIEIRTGALHFAEPKPPSYYAPAEGEFDGAEWVVTDLR